MSRLAVGSMYMYDATQTITIDAVDQYHAIYGFSQGSSADGVTYLTSASGAITNTADNGGTLRCTDVAHGLTTGQYITLTGMGDTAHAGPTRVTVIGVDTFDCDDISYNSSGDSGSWNRGDSLTVSQGHGGIFVISYAMSAASAGNNKVYKLEPVKNATGLDEMAVERKIAVANDLGVFGTGGFCQLSGGDVIWLKVKGTTDATNLSIEHANLHINRL